MRIPLLAAVLFAVLAKADVALAQVPAPEEFIPHYTEQFTRHHRLVDYFEAVAEASPRVVVEQYGETYEGRPLMLAYVSSADNIARLEDLRTEHLTRNNFAEGTAPAGNLAVVWLSFSVHGNESAGSEASPRVLYDLATAKGDSLAGTLDNTVVILDPSLNPDGYTRYTDDQRRRATTFLQPHPSAWEHHEGWPNGRTNHYLFDLNRDWAWATQQETQARLKAYRRWMPHVHADLHEMGVNSSYYFAPAAEPYHEYITDFQRDFQGTIGRNHARIFDREGWLYYTGEVFDLLYPSYGDTYPTFNGAIGMTYEQGGSGRAGRAILRTEGDTLTLADRIAHHHATALSTVAVASRHADRLVAAAKAYRRAAKDAPRGEFEAYVFPRASNPATRLTSLTALLDRHDIAYAAAAKSTSLSGTPYAGGSTRSQRINSGDLVVPARQVNGVLAQVLLDPIATVPDSLTYDITAWSLPTVLGIEGFATAQAVATSGSFQATATTTAEQPPAYGYAIPVDGLGAWTTVAPLLHEGLVARYAPTEITSGSAKLPAGSLFVMARDQEDAAYAKTYQHLREAGLAMQPLAGGFSTAGLDLGSDDVRRIDAPTVVLVQDDALNVNAFGHVWHYFEQRLMYPVRPVPWSRISASSLADVDVVIVTDGSLDLSGSSFAALEDWVRAGGRLIAMERSAESIGARDGFGLADKEDKPSLSTDSDVDPMRPYAQRQRDGISDNIPGALLKTQVDYTHPLAFGLGDSFYALRVDNRPWAFLDDGYNVIGVREGAEVKGFVGQRVREQLEETLTLGVQPLGRGEVIYAADNLAYRGFWEHGMQVLSNAVFYR